MLWDTALIYVVRIRRAGITKLTLQQLWIHWACHDPYGNFPPRSLPIVLPVKWEFVSWFRNTFSSTSQSHSRVQQYSKKAFCVPPVFQYNSSNHSKTSLPMPCFVFYFPISSKWFHPIQFCRTRRSHTTEIVEMSRGGRHGSWMVIQRDLL